MIEREFSVDSPSLVKVAIASGRVAVEAGEPGVVRVSVDTRDPTFDIRQRGDAIVAGGEKARRAFVTVQVPQPTDVEVSTASGDVNIVTPVARLEVASASGDVSFNTAIRLQVKTASGSVSGNRVEGEARCITASGRHPNLTTPRTRRSLDRVGQHHHRSKRRDYRLCHSVRRHPGGRAHRAFAERQVDVGERAYRDSDADPAGPRRQYLLRSGQAAIPKCKGRAAGTRDHGEDPPGVWRYPNRPVGLTGPTPRLTTYRI